MRISFALPGLAGLAGGMRVAAQYARYLHENGHEVSLIIRRPDLRTWRNHLLHRLKLRDGFPPLPDLKGHFDGLNMPIIHLNEDQPIRSADIPDADVIISTWWTTAEWSHTLPPTKGRHVHFIQDYEDFVPKHSTRIADIYNQKNIKIVVSGWIKDILRERHNQESFLVSNGVDTNQFNFSQRCRNSFPQIGFLYNGHPRKNVALAITALDLARKDVPELRAVAFGDKKRPDNFPDWIVYEQRPSQERIPQIYASCDLWLFTSKSEGFGLPLLEAMASGTPVLATRAGAAPDLVDGKNGWLIDAEAATYAKAIIAFLEQPEAKWHEASRSARQTAEKHDLTHAGQAFEAALLTLATGLSSKGRLARKTKLSSWVGFF